MKDNISSWAPARHQRLLALVRDTGFVRTSDLRRRFGVTAMTLWRDLKFLEEQGLLRRVRGGARSREGVPGEPDFETKDIHAHEAKRIIARLAVETFVRPGDTLALEGGTTVAAVVEELPTGRVSVFTNSLPIALRLRERRPGLAVQIAGGWLSPVSGNTTGPQALNMMDSWKASVCFIGATGFDASWGPSDPNPLEIEAKRHLASRARRVILLVDASKFGQRSHAVTLHPRHIAAIVTNAKPPRDIVALAQKHGIQLVYPAKKR